MPDAALPPIKTCLFLEDFEVTIDIGIHDFEIGTPQRLLINVEIEVDGADVHSDNIDQVLDYDFIREEINRLTDARRYNLQETLCRDILTALFARPDVVAATVSTRKTDVYPDCRSVGCRMSARR